MRSAPQSGSTTHLDDIPTDAFVGENERIFSTFVDAAAWFARRLAVEFVQSEDADFDRQFDNFCCPAAMFRRFRFAEIGKLASIGGSAGAVWRGLSKSNVVDVAAGAGTLRRRKPQQENLRG
jgi:hypothetical protein